MKSIRNRTPGDAAASLETYLIHNKNHIHKQNIQYKCMKLKNTIKRKNDFVKEEQGQCAGMLRRSSNLMNSNVFKGYDKIVKTMKISIVILFICTFNLAAGNVHSQNKEVSLQLVRTSIEHAIGEIEKDNGYVFIYNEEVVPELKKQISLHAHHENIRDVLDQLFNETSLAYNISGKQVIVYKKNDTKEESATSVTVVRTERQPSQTGQTVSGRIVDSHGEPVIGATIIVQGDETKGAITDIDGNYTLAGLPDNAMLIISYVGMQTQRIALEGRTSLNIIMMEDVGLLDEVVVVGYGTMKRENLTGSVSQVKMDEILGDRPVNNAWVALQGAIPGLTVSGGSTPGQDNKTINIRGTLSINGGSPLVLIDNVPGSLNMINPEDIESVSVLKDAASSAIYGARAANGVVLITTKRPRSGTNFQLNYNNNFGFSTSINRPEQASLTHYFQAYKDAGFSNSYWSNNQDVTKWAQYVEEYKKNPESFQTIGDGIYVENNIPYFLNEKDLFDNVLTNGFYNSHNVSASGGTEKVRYRMAGGLSSEDGPLITDKDYYRRANISAFISADMTSWFTQELDIRYAQSKKTMPEGRGNDIYTLRLINYYPEGMLPGSLTLNGKDLPLFTPKNLLLYGNTSQTIRNNPRIFSKSIFRPINDLEIAFEYTFDRDDFNYSYYTDKWEHTTIQRAASVAPSNDVYTRKRYYTDYNAINAYLTYSKSFKSHSMKVMGGYNQESSFYEYIENQVKDQVAAVIPSLGNSTGEMTNKENYSEYTIRSGFFRLNYNYLDKYLIEVNGRYDGSSKFPKSKRFGFFPSVSAGWQLGKEGFMDFSGKWLDELKVRGSWGRIGNQAINPYQYTPSMAINNSNAIWLIDGKKVTTIGLPSLVSNTFTWETVETIDVGLDFALLNYRLRGTFDWYKRDTKGMLTKAGALELPAVVGAEAPAQNGADMQTKGWEVGISWRDQIGKVGYNIGFNLYDHRSFITKFANEAGLFYDRNEAQNAKRYREGMELGEIWGYQADGYYSVSDFTDLTSWKLKEGVPSIQGINVRPGDVKFKNLRDDENSKNRIDVGDNTATNPGDRSIIGNSTPRFQFGANFGINYEGFDLSIMLQGVGKRDFWLGGHAVFPFAGSSASDAIFNPVYYNQLDYWKPKSEDPSSPDYMIPQNPNATYYRLYGQVQNVGSNTRISDKFLQNGAYLRVKNITLSYMLPKTWVEKARINQLKLFVGIENLATFTTLPKGIDPERMSWNYPFYRTVSFGTSITF